jgi:hypothetical protein
VKPGDRYEHFKGGRYEIVSANAEECHYLNDSKDTFIGYAHDAENPEKVYAVFRSFKQTTDKPGSWPDCVFGFHAEGSTDEEPVPLVIYKSLKDGKWWIRTKKNFNEMTVPKGKTEAVPRFKRF